MISTRNLQNGFPYSRFVYWTGFVLNLFLRLGLHTIYLNTTLTIYRQVVCQNALHARDIWNWQIRGRGKNKAQSTMVVKVCARTHSRTYTHTHKGTNACRRHVNVLLCQSYRFSLTDVYMYKETCVLRPYCADDVNLVGWTADTVRKCW